MVTWKSRVLFYYIVTFQNHNIIWTNKISILSWDKISLGVQRRGKQIQESIGDLRTLLPAGASDRQVCTLRLTSEDAPPRMRRRPHIHHWTLVPSALVARLATFQLFWELSHPSISINGYPMITASHQGRALVPSAQLWLKFYITATRSLQGWSYTMKRCMVYSFSHTFQSKSHSEVTLWSLYLHHVVVYRRRP